MPKATSLIELILKKSDDADSEALTPSLNRAVKQGFTNPQYHASMQDFDSIVPGYNDGLFFTTPDPKFASQWAGKGKLQSRLGELDSYDRYKPQQEKLYESMGSPEYGTPEYDEFARLSDIIYQQEQNAFKTVYPLLARTEKTFDPAKDFDDLADLFTEDRLKAPVSTDFPTFADALKSGNYIFYENPEVVQHLKNKGYDSMLLRESTSSKEAREAPYTTVAHFYPERNIRSQFAEFAEGYAGPNIMGGAALPITAGLLAAGQSDDADASVASLAKRGLELVSPDGKLFSVLEKGPDVGPRREVAYAEMGSDLNGGLSARDMAVTSDYRGNGLMGETYDAIEEVTGKNITPSNWLTDDGAKFWVKRDRQLIEDMYQDGQFDWDDGFEDKVGRALERGNADPRLLAGIAALTGTGMLAPLVVDGKFQHSATKKPKVTKKEKKKEQGMLGELSDALASLSWLSDKRSKLIASILLSDQFEKGMEHSQLPARGIWGTGRLAAGAALGEKPSDTRRAANRIYTQPTDKTLQEAGQYVLKKTGSPAAAAATSTLGMLTDPTFWL